MCHRGLKCVCVFGLSQNCVSLWEEHALQAFWSKRDKRPMEQTWTQIADWSWAQPWSAKSSPYADMWARINDWISFKTFYFELLLNFSSVQSLSRVWLFVTPRTAAHQASLSITNSQSLLKLMSIQSVMPSKHIILCHPLQSFPESGFFPMSQFFTSGGQSIGVSALASVLPMNIQDWFPLELTDLISLQSKGLSRVFSNTTVQKHQFFSAQLSL